MRLRGLRALAWNGGALYVSSGYRLFRLDPGAGVPPAPVGRFDARPWRRATGRWRPTARLFRDGFHALATLPDGTLVAAVAGAIVVLRAGGARFEVTHRVTRGTRPLALAVTPQGHVFWGEYFSNPHREAVHVYGSRDGGQHWDIVHTFAAGVVRHVHGVVYDGFADCLWVLTGDDDRESAIWKVSPDWRRCETVVEGSQQARAVTLQPTPEALYFATDTPAEQNWIYRLDRRGDLQRLAPISGSCFWSAQAGGRVFFSTAVEPSRRNTSPLARLYGGSEADGWQQLLAWRRDRWPGRLFQYPNIVFASGRSDRGLLAATGVAVRDNDEVTSVWRVGAA
ncbi:MAG: hypothetical protein HY727_01235 [Candidatus Rokubacteria bacterium]|nr:hypothetical protein [Candidatus Rokubacteria bacterium]